jgi:conjugal transfer pilus assembly protein TraE
MLWNKYKFKMDKYVFENWTFRIITLILSGVIIFEGYLISEKVNNQKVVILPPKMSKPFWVAGNQVSKAYLEQMGQFIAFYLFNINANTAKISIENILPFVEPKYYGEIKKVLYEQVAYIEDNDISRVFYPSVVKVDKKGELKVIGILKDLISNKVVSTRQVKLNIKYKIKQGRFWITSIIVKEKK